MVEGWSGAAGVCVCLGQPVPVSQASGGTQEVFTAERGAVPPPCLPALRLRVSLVFLAGRRGRTRGAVVEQDVVVRYGVRRGQPRRHGGGDAEMVCGQVWPGGGG